MSSSGDLRGIARSRQALEYLQVRGYYSTAYTGIVQPDRIFAVTDYFRRHWVPLLKPGPAWLVVALRQHCYWNGQRDWCIVGRDTLAAECGIAVRTVDNYLGLPLVDWFVTGRQARYVDREDGARHRDWSAYSLRLDEPLTPGHQAALAGLAHGLAAGCEAAEPAARAVELAGRLLDLDPAALLKSKEPDPPDRPAEARQVRDQPRSIAQIIGEAAGLDGPPADEGQRQALEHAADALYRRIVRPDKVTIATQYFRRAWVPLLGAARAWLVLHLRARCYLNAHTLEIRDTCTIGGLAELATVLGVSLSTVKVCLAESPAGVFFEQRATRRPKDGVQMVFRIEMIDPLVPDDQARYDAALAGEKLPQQPDFADSPSAQKPAIAGSFSEQQPDSADSPKKQEPVSAASPSQQQPDFAPGTDQPPDFAARDAGQEPDSARIGDPAKSQNVQDSRLLVNTFELENTQQPQVLLRDAAPDRPLAAAAGPLAAVLADLHVQEPSRSRLLKQAPPIAAVLAWTLEAFARDRITNKTGFVVAMLQAGYDPPADLERLAALPVAAWRELALAVRQARRTGRAELPPDLAAPFQALYACLGHLEPGEWPIGLEATSSKRQATSEEAEEGNLFYSGGEQESFPALAEQAQVVGGEQSARPEDGADALHTAQVAWMAVLDSLQWQIDRGTFDAWLKRSRVVRAAGDCWTVAVADPRAVDWLRHRLRPAIERAARWTVGREVTVEFEKQGS